MRYGESIMERGNQRNKREVQKGGGDETERERERDLLIHREAEALVPVTPP